MNNNTNQPGSTGAKRPLSSRPTLASSAAAASWEDSRILSNSDMGALTRNNPSKKIPISADNRAKAKPSVFGTGLKTLATVSVLCVGSFLVGQYVSERRHDARVAKEQANPAATTPRVAVTPLALPPVSAPAEPGDAPPVVLVGTAQTPAETVQTINEPLSQTVPTPAPAAPAQVPATTTNGKLTTTPENGVRPPPATLEKALQPSAVAIPQNSAPVTAKIQQAKASTKPPVAVAKATVPSTMATEKDINLLAALVAHNNANASKPFAPNADTNATDAAQRVPEESADSLLKRCTALRPERQAACRLNACSGARVSDPACKTTATSPQR